MEHRNKQIRELLNEIGIPAKLKGRCYIAKALELLLEYPDLSSCKITEVLYPGVAREYGARSQNVERAIRHTIEHVWLENDYDMLYRLFGNSVSSRKGKPTNKEFLCQCAEILREREQ